MVIPAAHQHRYLFHFTHIDNLPLLLRQGLLANNHPRFPKREHRSVAAKSIQERRADMAVPCGPGGVVHNYVPLYFGSLSPMLLQVLHTKNIDQRDILYFEFPISLLDRQEVVFTDASANTAEPPQFMFDPADLHRLDWQAIDSLKWKNADDGFRHRRMAEALVLSSLDLTLASRCVVWDDGVKAVVEAAAAAAGAAFPAVTLETKARRHFYKDFIVGDPNDSLVYGPKETRIRLELALRQIAERENRPGPAAPFKTLQSLLYALRQDFACIPQTAELVGLKSENGIHRLTVDNHTHEVVRRLRELPRFTALESRYQEMAELAAYLHDIGKGPKSRWQSNGGRQKVDDNHPVRAMPLMVEIMTQQVAPEASEHAERVCKLVCYHDLVGDVLGNGRDEQQIVEAANDKADLDMLFALGEADATSLIPWWWDQAKAGLIYNRCLRAIQAKVANQ